MKDCKTVDTPLVKKNMERRTEGQVGESNPCQNLIGGLMRSGKPLKGYCDADWANCTIDRRSYTGYAFKLSGGLVSWESKKQPTVALSSAEAEYMALASATKEACYLRRFIYEITALSFKYSNSFASIPFEQRLAIDEQMCSTKIGHYLKQYLPNKAHKWGFKLFLLCSINCYAHKFEVYAGFPISCAHYHRETSERVLKLLNSSIDGKAILNSGQQNQGLLDQTLRSRLARLIATK
ncbi:hypothetical protein MSG28_000599 [Choristoneura fumiferana]|uniref:Uncharacterized protein n=1 Tax=Choristoneura fumiferana TaxID=7141 RepID=A0ACC0K1N8_CHOFU|nr:hypothetical protein MSG28_000599 [Choristoneura fumiferana]